MKYNHIKRLITLTCDYSKRLLHLPIQIFLIFSFESYFDHDALGKTKKILPQPQVTHILRYISFIRLPPGAIYVRVCVCVCVCLYLSLILGHEFLRQCKVIGLYLRKKRKKFDLYVRRDENEKVWEKIWVWIQILSEKSILTSLRSQFNKLNFVLKRLYLSWMVWCVTSLSYFWWPKLKIWTGMKFRYNVVFFKTKKIILLLNGFGR